LLISVFITSCSGDSDAVQMVKSGNLQMCPQKTVEQAVDGFFGSPKWESLTADDGNEYVNITGGMTYAGKDVEGSLQFVIAKTNESFGYQAFEINEIPQSDYIATELLTKMCE